MLLTEDPERGASGGLRALVGDFGLARHLGGAEALQSTTYGTVDHQAPEVLRDGRIAKVGAPLSPLWVCSAGAVDSSPGARGAA